MSDARSGSARPALRQAAVRALLTVAGLAVYWQLGMQDLHNFIKAAVFAIVANLGLGGLALVLPWRRAGLLAGAIALPLNGLVLATAGVEGFLYWLYGLTPKHIVIADAILGSNANEVREFIASYWPHLLLVASLPLSLVGLLAWLERRHAARHAGEGARAARSRRTLWAGGALLLLPCALHLNSTMRDENPLVYWPHYFQDYRAQRAFMEDVRRKVARDLERAQQDPASYAGPSEHTVVLVLGESVNRANWSLYGYQRPTTPQLERRRGELLVFRNVHSADAATVQSLIKMLTPATLDEPEIWHDQPNVLALARSAGYRVYWLSNQERADGPIQILAEHAHRQVYVNSGRGRESRSLDEQLLAPLERLLAEPAPRKLIVLHMLGAHLRYDLRYPRAYDRFSQREDGVAEALRAAGRPFWIRRARDEYDNAMLYGDHVLSAILDRTQRAARGRGARAASLLYVSDHGQEVGHHRDFAGHSSSDPSGYQVPMFLWTNRADKTAGLDRAAVERRAYRTDKLDHTLVGLLDIRARGYRAEHDLLSAGFVTRGALATAPVMPGGALR